MHLTSCHNANYEKKIKLEDVLGKNPLPSISSEVNKADPEEILRAFKRIFPVPKEAKKKDNSKSKSLKS